MIKKNIIKTITMTLATGICACSSSPKIQEFPETANATDELQHFSSDMQTANAKQVDVLAPDAYRHAEMALKSANEDLKDGKDAKVILHEVAQGQAQLNRANKFSELSRSNMEDVVAARQAAMLVEANKSFGKDFSKADDHLRSVTADIEDNDLNGVAKNRSKLQSEYLALELRAIQQTNLGSARSTIALAIKEGAKDYAKQSLAIAEKSANDTDAFIVANRHQSDAIKARSEESMTAADHLLKITRAAKMGKNTSPEQAALVLENQQNKTQDKQDELTVANGNAADAAIETKNLKSDQAFNKSFETARAEFTNKEAEVYRKGNKLVIRLRSLEFPENEAVLKGSNFPLLAKVAKVVKGFENSSVVVEGHTDSVGGKVLNHNLSLERSKAVSTYLVSNDAISEEKISGVGYGFDRPLASNKTEEGRAQNRRVDIVITPQM